MKKYIKPEAELVEFESEEVAVDTDGGDKDYNSDLLDKDDWV